MQICWDHFFPESSRVLALKGAELLVMPTHGFLECRAMARAVDNGIYVATAYFWNDGTAIYAPDGTIVDKATGKGYAIAEIDLNKICYVRYLSCNSRGEPNDYYLHTFPVRIRSTFSSRAASSVSRASSPTSF